uniref:(northern house mosquito) hypothetical protein n=1 Tax=Culex pipiens TaxID=7175 RepID=A0A8D8PBT3_CULPI
MDCPVPCRRRNRSSWFDVCVVWRRPKWLDPATAWSTTLLIRGNSSRRWRQSALAGCSSQVRSTELPVMRRRPHRGFLPELMPLQRSSNENNYLSVEPKVTLGCWLTI